jgi:hypothetical protein
MTFPGPLLEPREFFSNELSMSKKTHEFTKLTKSSPQSWLDTTAFSDQDGCFWILLLYFNIVFLYEISAKQIDNELFF